MDLLLRPGRPDGHLTLLLLKGTAYLVAAALVAVTVFGVYHLLGHPPGRHSPWRVVLQILTLSVAWLLTNGPLEGRLLWTPAASHGVTQADLAVVPPLLVAGLVALMELRG